MFAIHRRLIFIAALIAFILFTLDAAPAPADMRPDADRIRDALKKPKEDDGGSPGATSPGSTSPAAAARAKAGRALKLDKGVEAKLGKLSPSQLVEVDGKQMTVGDLRKKIAAEQKQSAVRWKAAVGNRGPDVSAVQAKFDKEQSAALEASNAKVRAEVDRLKSAKAAPAGASGPSTEALRKEAAAIQTRLNNGTASPADQKRALEILNTLQQ